MAENGGLWPLGPSCPTSEGGTRASGGGGIDLQGQLWCLQDSIFCFPACTRFIPKTHSDARKPETPRTAVFAVPMEMRLARCGEATRAHGDGKHQTSLGP